MPTLLKRTIHVVDDDADVRHSLTRLLVSAGFEPVVYERPEKFLEAARRDAHGCALLDVYMPGIGGLTLQEELQKLGCHLPVVVMTGQADVSIAVRAMKAGAVDFIERPFDEKTLLGAIELALAKSSDPGRVAEMSEATRRVARMSVREREVLAGLIAGKSNKVIAFDLGISVRTVEVHRARMMERLGVRQLAAAVRLAVLARMEY